VFKLADLKTGANPLKTEVMGLSTPGTHPERHRVTEFPVMLTATRDSNLFPRSNYSEQNAFFFFGLCVCSMAAFAGALSWRRRLILLTVGEKGNLHD